VSQVKARILALLSVCVAVVGLAADAAAQTQSTAAKPQSPKRPKEFFVGGLITGPSSMGSADATLTSPSGTPVTLFTTENGAATGFGLELGLGFELRKALWVEATGGWIRANLTTEITNDFENADSEPIESPMSRFMLGGGVLYYFKQGPKTSWFVRGSGGWMRETAGGASLTGDGFIGGAGIGLRHWWRTAGKGAVKRMGLRAEFRADIRTGGISLGESGVRFGPGGAVHLVFGY
jgi:hypothetical protein